MRIKVAIVGASLGFLLGILGGIFAGVPFGILLLRALFASLLGAGLLSLALIAVEKLLPDLIQETSKPDTIDMTGNSVDITLPEEPMPSDQASELRAMAREEQVFNQSQVDSGDDMIDEVQSEVVQSEFAANQDENFSEAAFYAGIEQLPDIGGFSESFSANGEASSQSSSEPEIVESYASSSSSKSSSRGASGLDPKLIAQAIRTSLKKDQS